VDVLVVLLGLLLLAVVIALVGAPLRAARDRELAGEHVSNDEDPERRQAYERAQLESAREAKYGEIRDAELDMRTGKLSREDYEAVDGALRAEALEVLDRLQALEREEGNAGASQAVDGQSAEAAGSDTDQGEGAAKP
jgi:Na+-transporting methylmalonyl-CoA/oxaloacetate decarboxylase gamma subunit